MSEEKMDIRPAENPLDLIEIIPGYRGTKSTHGVPSELQRQGTEKILRGPGENPDRWGIFLSVRSIR